MPYLRAALLCALLANSVAAQEAATLPVRDTSVADRRLAEYFRNETARLSAASMGDLGSLDDWVSRRPEYVRQLQEMLGLDPLPEKTDLKPVITGRTDHELFTVENLHFQSRPGLYVTGNLYIPKGLAKPAPTVLYVCGHGEVKKDGVSYGNKTHYQHHPAWLARNGYVCLTIDTLQLGEIQGKHHGTYNQGQWWWISRGYTPAGVEAWNCIRAIDYLQTRSEVDGERIGVTGRSGGGAYSWWIAALDERIKAAVPVAGITDLEDHVVVGCVEGHCDCMYFVNTYRWDYDLLAALVAPRPLLIGNTDKDPIFPLDGVERIHRKVRRVYELYGARDNLGLLITEGPHKDTQDLQVPAFHWFNRFLKGEDAPVENVGQKLFDPEQLKVFAQLPADEQNTQIERWFTPAAPAWRPPADWQGWQRRREQLRADLRRKSFGGWPADDLVDPGPGFATAKGDPRGERIMEFVEFESQPHVQLSLSIVRHITTPPREIVLRLRDDEFPTDAIVSDDELANGKIVVTLYPRGRGADAWNVVPAERVHIRRRFMLLGQSVAGMQAWDVRRAVHTLKREPRWSDLPVRVEAQGAMANVALYASIFEPKIEGLTLDGPVWGDAAPEVLNLERLTTYDELLLLAAESRFVVVKNGPATAADEFAKRFADKFGLELRLR